MRILYTDDDLMFLDIAREFLRGNGFEVDIADSATGAMRMVEESEYDALVSDFQMPNIDGIELLRQLRAKDNNIPFILFTGRGREIAIEALNSGADYCLQKGGNPKAQFDELVHHIIRAVERRMAEVQLSESREKFRALVEVIGDWRWEMDDRGRYTYCSPQVVDVIGFQPNELMGMWALDYMPFSERSRAISKASEELTNTGKIHRMENTRTHRNGSLVYVESSVVPILDGQNKIVGYRGVDRNVTREREMERALAKANHRLEILENVTWHDTMNQLSILTGNIEMLKIDVRPEANGKYLKRIELAANSIRNHMDFTRDYQRMGMSLPEWLDVQRVFAQAVEMLDLRDIDVVCEVRDLEIRSDPMLVKAFFNMIDNSLRYGQKVTHIRLYTVTEGQAINLFYADNGVGIPDGQKDLIFEKGFGNNTGLGMFLIKSILNITNIDIKETGAPGLGIRLEMRVPQDMFRYTNDPASVNSFPKTESRERARSITKI